MKSALRLRGSADFARARREGKVYRHPALALNVCANALSHNRYGIVAGKWLGGAVRRNRVKRQLRAALRDMHGCLRAGFDIVVIARSPLLGQPFDEMRRILKGLLARARLLAPA